MNQLSLCHIIFTITLVSGSLFFTPPARAEIIPTLTAPEVKNMIDNGGVLLINTLSCLEFEIQHIPTSINIPVITMKETVALPEDKNTQLIFYCMGIR